MRSLCIGRGLSAEGAAAAHIDRAHVRAAAEVAS